MILKIERFFLIIFIFLISFSGWGSQGFASVIRDAEIETILKSWTEPIAKAAGLDPDNVNIILVNNPQVNAFVAGGPNIFIYTGLIFDTENAGEIIGVIAHEAGHIRGGHLAGIRNEYEDAAFETLLGTILGIGVAVATGEGGFGASVSAGTSSMAQRSFLAGNRLFESSADQAALTYLERAGFGAKGLVSFLSKLEGQEMLPQNMQSEYVRTHPLTRNRLEVLREKASKISGKSGNEYPPEWEDQYLRIKSKLSGFLNDDSVIKKLGKNFDTSQNIYSRYAQAIALYRQSRTEQAIKAMDNLISSEKDNPYFYELKGQMLKEFGRVEESIKYYEKASNLSKSHPLIDIEYAHSLLEKNRKRKSSKEIEQAILLLKKAEQKEPRSIKLQRMLALGYGLIGEESKAKLHIAEEFLLRGDYKSAKQQAEIALQQFPENTPERIRAKDIIRTAEGKQKK